jgi:hypothetical protein
MGCRPLLIDSSHKGWFVVTLALGAAATVAYFWFDQGRPGGVTGGSVVGLWYGIIGSALMIYAGLLSALRKVPSWWWIGSRKVWLRGHIWLGLLSLLFIVYHSGFRLGGPLEQALWVILTLTIVTGIFGLLLQQIVPRMISNRIACEMPYEQIPHLCMVLRRRADAAIDAVCGPVGASRGVEAGEEMAVPIGGAPDDFRRFYEDEVRPFLDEPYRPKSPLANPQMIDAKFASMAALSWSTELRGLLANLKAFCEERRNLGEQERLHLLLHGWLLVHVPLSVALLVLGLAHAAWSLYY